MAEENKNPQQSKQTPPLVQPEANSTINVNPAKPEPVQPAQPAAPASKPAPSAAQPAQSEKPVAAQQPAQPAAPASKPAPSAAQPAQSEKPAQQVQKTTTQKQPATAVSPQQRKPGQPLQPGQKPSVTRKPPNPKKMIIGCTGCSGAAVIFFVIFVLIFVSQTTATGENPLATSLGMNTATLINTLITLVNLIFGTISLFLFVLGVIGLFRIFMARKDDKVTKTKGVKMAGISGLLLFIFVVSWIGIYIFTSSKQVPVDAPRDGIVTEPAATLGLTAPVTITFDSSHITAGNKYEILSRLWDFGDGNSSTVALTSNTYTEKGPANGRYDVRMQVTKRDKQTGEEVIDTYTTVVTIANVELGAIFTATPESGPAPLEVEFDASDSAAPAGQITDYEWDFDNNNVFTDASGVNVKHTFEQLGTYKVNLRVTDNTGQYKVESKDIVVSGDNAPMAVIDIPTTDGKYFVGQQYSFQGEKSSSPSGSIADYEWDFGDGSAKANTRTATHIYKESGEYEIILKIEDENGTKAEASKKITLEIQESAPIAAINSVPKADEDENVINGTVPFEISFNGTDSKDSDNNIVDYKWDFDGDGNEDAAGETVKYVYKESGKFNATLTVIDAENNESKAVVVVDVSSQPLQAKIVADPLEGVIPLTVTFDASSSSYPNGQIVSYEWNFGDGSAKRIDVSKVTYKYTKIGTFTASVTAVASDNSRSTAEMPVNVRPISLNACYKAVPESGEAPMEVSFDPSCSTGTVAKWSWDFGDGETTKTRKPKHTFNTPGNYEVMLEVSDNQNVVSTFSNNILVTGNL